MGLVWLVDPLILGSEAWAHLRCMQWVHHQVHPAASERHKFPLFYLRFPGPFELDDLISLIMINVKSGFIKPPS
jgi:hypothetical protein